MEGCVAYKWELKLLQQPTEGRQKKSQLQKRWALTLHTGPDEKPTLFMKMESKFLLLLGTCTQIEKLTLKSYPGPEKTLEPSSDRNVNCSLWTPPQLRTCKNEWGYNPAEMSSQLKLERERSERRVRLAAAKAREQSLGELPHPWHSALFSTLVVHSIRFYIKSNRHQKMIRMKKANFLKEMT